MKYRLLEILACPQCGGDLQLKVFHEEASPGEQPPVTTMPRCRVHCARLNLPAAQVPAGECTACYRQQVIDGLLTCNCGQLYPVIGGIPRMLPDELLRESLHRYHGGFLAAYGPQLRVLNTPPESASSTAKARTLHAFSYQWTSFVRNFDYYRDIFLSFVTPFLRPEDFRDKLVLEAGCGSGRPASIACSFGAEVVAVDLSEAVQTAHAMSQHYPLLHVVQGDIYHLPVKPRFDFVYSVGVIQHLPDPRAAFKSIAKTVSPGTKLVVWVYGVRELWYRPIDWLRTLTLRLPFRLLHGLSFMLAVLSEIFLLIPYRVLSRIPFTAKLAEAIPGRIYARFPFKENVLGWFDRLGAPVTHYFTENDVQSMMHAAGFEHVRVVRRPGASASWIAEGSKP